MFVLLNVCPFKFFASPKYLRNPQWEQKFFKISLKQWINIFKARKVTCYTGGHPNSLKVSNSSLFLIIDMFFQPLSVENGTFFQPEVEFTYKIPAFKQTPKQQ